MRCDGVETGVAPPGEPAVAAAEMDTEETNRTARGAWQKGANTP